MFARCFIGCFLSKKGRKMHRCIMVAKNCYKKSFFPCIALYIRRCYKCSVCGASLYKDFLKTASAVFFLPVISLCFSKRLNRYLVFPFSSPKAITNYGDNLLMDRKTVDMHISKTANKVCFKPYASLE